MGMLLPQLQQLEKRHAVRQEQRICDDSSDPRNNGKRVQASAGRDCNPSCYARKDAGKQTNALTLPDLIGAFDKTSQRD